MMQITRAGSQPSGKGPTEYFSGSVRIDPLDGKVVDWLEKLTDEEYAAAAAKADAGSSS